MTLHFYIARKFTLYLLAILGIFGAIMVLIDMVEELRDFDTGTLGIGGALHLSLLKVPGDLYTILPLIAVMATVALFLALARSSELVVARASGRSALRSLTAPVVVALVYGVIAVAIFNPIIAATSRQYDSVSSRHKGREASVLSVSSEGLWLRQGSLSGQTVIRAARADAQATRFYDVTFLSLDAKGAPVWRIEAAEARLRPQGWDIRDAKRWGFGPEIDNPEARAAVSPQLVLPSDLTLENIRDSFARPAAVAIWDLPAFIAGLDRAGFSALPQRVWFQMELAMPLVMAAMVLLGAAFTMRHVRFGRTGMMAMLALGLGLGLFFLRNFAQVLGENGQIPVALAAWSPPLAGILLSLGLLLHLEDG
ncbi:LPS export ABC transporter permease LptG [Rhodovulum visakhapatnamense]|uniref:Lipopolysaccharide export system permease protein n=1 Tax=Rhodovulum visakhapatnamense TaxID=364297 RepID=A0A4R8FN59_9RHOB|nr:LPS export ABC transporter permease LptG [Rhodovulum visakhapatnamense]TDX27709.1 lipopolysaccharide export system permease protein [Rhodovulum visakhapatnamense]